VALDLVNVRDRVRSGLGENFILEGFEAFAVLFEDREITIHHRIE
jgi:hypothetical protein